MKSCKAHHDNRETYTKKWVNQGLVNRAVFFCVTCMYFKQTRLDTSDASKDCYFTL